MSRIAPLSGFPEWLPEGRLIELHALDQLRKVFELHGFSGIETRAVEPMAQLASKGDIDKEIYLLHRLQADTTAEDKDPGKRLGLHYDLTVPFARYVMENHGKLDFPFKRYQIQKVWRGERPQDGRFREFVQADIDVVGQGELPFHYEVDLPLVMAEALSALPIGPFVIHASNRKVAEGFYRGLGFEDPAAVIRIVDKFDKLGPQAVGDLLQSSVNATASQIQACIALAGITSFDDSFAQSVMDLGVDGGPLLAEGLEELVALVAAANSVRPGILCADLRIARGLDYYTGSVYETFLAGAETLGSICSGGRYDSLVSIGGQRLPGVGLSIGVSRILSRIIGDRSATASRAVPTAVLVAVADEDHRAEADTVARALRSRGVPADVSPTAAKFGKQIKFADKRGIPFVWFTTDGVDEVKDIRSGDQAPVDRTLWMPPESDVWPTVKITDPNVH